MSKTWKEAMLRPRDGLGFRILGSGKVVPLILTSVHLFLTLSVEQMKSQLNSGYCTSVVVLFLPPMYAYCIHKPNTNSYYLSIPHHKAESPPKKHKTTCLCRFGTPNLDNHLHAGSLHYGSSWEGNTCMDA